MHQYFLARQPVFDVKGKVWGYELLYREHIFADHAKIEDQESSTLKVASGMLLSPDYDFREAYRIVNASPEFLRKGQAQAIADETTIFSLTPELTDMPGMLPTLESLLKEGAKLSLEINKPPSAKFEHLSLFHLVEISLELIGLLQDWKRFLHDQNPHAKIHVTKIEDQPGHDQAIKAGADFFQGFFFQRPKTYAIKPFPASMINKFKILNILATPEADVHELTKAIESDVTVTVRLLKLINSAAFSFIRRIDSVRQAIALAGLEKLKNWLHLIIATEFVSENTTKELAYSSAIRAKFLEILALQAGRQELAGKLYLAGLFSLLEPMLGRPYAEIFKDLSISKEVEQALLGQPCEISQWINFIDLLETGNWLKIDSTAMGLGLELKAISDAKLQSISWANRFFSSIY